MSDRFSSLRAVVLLSALLGFAVTACEANQPGARCDGFFSNGCKSPLDCLDTGDKKICVKECDTSLKCEDPAGCCESGYECTKVTMDITKNGVSTGIQGPTYSYCLAKK